MQSDRAYELRMVQYTVYGRPRSTADAMAMLPQITLTNLLAGVKELADLVEHCDKEIQDLSRDDFRTAEINVTLTDSLDALAELKRIVDEIGRRYTTIIHEMVANRVAELSESVAMLEGTKRKAEELMSDGQASEGPGPAKRARRADSEVSTVYTPTSPVYQ